MTSSASTLRSEVYTKGSALLGVSITAESAGIPEAPASARLFILYDASQNSDEVKQLLKDCQEIFPGNFSEIRIRTNPPRLANDLDDLIAAEVPSAEEVAASYVLAQPEAKLLARAVKSTGDVLSNALPGLLSKQEKIDVQAAREALLESGVLQSEMVVMCRKTGSLVNRIPDSDVLDKLTKLQVRCSCGESMDNEDIEEALRVSPLGYKLLDKSQWMNVVLVNELLLLGIPIAEIFIEQQFGGDEVDCLAIISGDLVLFELKDGEFNLGHAYSFNAKNGLLNPDVSVVITTNRVGNDAKEHFERTRKALESSRRGRVRTDNTTPILMEGMEELRADLEKLMNRLVARDARRLLQNILDTVAFRAMPVIMNMTGDQSADEE